MTDNALLTYKFERLFISYFPGVKTFIAAILKSETEAEDLAQDLFVRLWGKRDIWENDEVSHGGYIYAMARNAAIDHIRKKSRAVAVPSEIPLERLEGLPFEDNLLDPLYLEEMQLLLELAVERLPKKRQEIFRMSRYDSLSNSQIAEKLGISVRTVEHQIHLAMKELRKIIFLLLLLQMGIH